MRPDKIFGLIYFQQDYSNVYLDPKQDVEKQYEKKRRDFVSKIKARDYKTMKFTEWNEKKVEFEKKFDEENKHSIMEELLKTSPKTPLCCNLPTKPDAEKMLEYLSDLFCKNVRDVTVMSSK